MSSQTKSFDYLLHLVFVEYLLFFGYKSTYSQVPNLYLFDFIIKKTFCGCSFNLFFPNRKRFLSSLGSILKLLIGKQQALAILHPISSSF